MSGLVLDEWLSMCEHWRALALKYYEPLSESKCNEIVQEALQVIKNHSVPESTKATGNDSSGWRDSIHLDDDGHFVRFTTCKTLLNVDMKQLVDHTWTLYSDGDAFKKAHLGDNCDFYLQVLQTLSTDTMIVQRVEKHPGLARVTHSVGIAFRVQTETGYLVAFRCIESPQLQSVMKAEGLSLCGSFTWDKFDVEHRNGECDGILFTVAGSIGSDDPAYARQARDGLMNSLMLYETKLEDTPVLSV